MESALKAIIVEKDYQAFIKRCEELRINKFDAVFLQEDKVGRNLEAHPRLIDATVRECDIHGKLTLVEELALDKIIKTIPAGCGGTLNLTAEMHARIQKVLKKERAEC